jgi:hypothetical protein
MEPLAVGTTTQSATGPGSTTTVTRLSRRCLCFTTVGPFDAAAGYFALAQTRAVLAEIGDGFTGLYEWSGVTGYASDVRLEATRHFGELRPRFHAAVFLTSSTLVSMGINVANIALGGFLFATTDRAEFEARLQAARARDVAVGQD